MDPEAIKNAEDHIARLQVALDDAQRVLHFAEKAERAAQEHERVMRTVALAAVGGLVAVALVAGRRHSHH